MSEDEISVGPYDQLDDDEQDELLDEEPMLAASHDASTELDDDDDDDGYDDEPSAEDEAAYDDELSLDDEPPMDDESDDEADDDDVPRDEDEDADGEASEDLAASLPHDGDEAGRENLENAAAPVAAVDEQPDAAPERVDDGRLAEIQAELAELATGMIVLRALADGMTEIHERLASIEARVMDVQRADRTEEPSIAVLLGEEPPPVTRSREEPETSLSDLVGTAPAIRAFAPVPPPPVVAPEPPLESVLEPAHEPALEPVAEAEPEAQPESQPRWEPEQDQGMAPLRAIQPDPQPEPAPAAYSEPTPIVALQPDPPPPAPEPPRVAEYSEPVPLHPAAFAPPDQPPAPLPAPEPVGAEGRFGLGSAVSVRVAPVAGFQELTRVQGALSQDRVVRRATVEAYARGEARLVVELAEATSAASLAESLGSHLNRIARVREVSEEQHTMKIMLG